MAFAPALAHASRRAFLAAALLLPACTALADEATAWAALRAGGHVALIRHASTEPGLGVRPRRKVLGRPLVEVAAR